MNIAFYLNDLPEGGVEKISYNLAVGLRNTGHNVIFIINSCSEDSNIRDKISKSFQTYILNTKHKKYYFTLPIILFIQLYKLIRLTREKKIDLIISSKERANFIAVNAKPFIKCKVVIYRHVSILDKNTNDSKFYTKYLYKYYLLIADQIIAVSNEIRNEILTFTNNNKVSNVHYIPNPVIGLDFYKLANLPNPYPESKNIKSILLAGRICYQKGFDILIDLLPQLFKQIDGFCLYILGEGPDKPILLDKLKQNGCSKLVCFLGYKENPYPYLKHCDLFIMPSRYEGMPTILIEALALNSSVITSNCKTGPKEILKISKYGILYKSKNELIDLIQIELRKNNHEHINTNIARHFSTENSTNLLLKLIE